MKRSRPYRSRRIPACLRCRTRRSKCTIETVGRPCLLCEQASAQCSAAISSRALSARDSTAFKSRSQHFGATQSTDVHVVPPVVAQDTQVLEGLLSNTNVDASIMCSDSRALTQMPIYQMAVTRRPNPAHCSCSENLPSRLARQVDPFLPEIMQLYLKELHPCLPMLDEKSLHLQLAARMPSMNFLVNFEAYALFYWNLSPALYKHKRPDQDFAWQAACSAMDASTTTGGLISIMAAVFNITGRPSKGVIHNMTNVARIVALSNSIGLNHDCSSWQLTDNEKQIRLKVWWAVLIHDRWFHFALGTPPLVNAAHYNVAVPTVTALINEDSHGDAALSARCYVALCCLTEIIGAVLPLVYHVRSGTTGLVSGQVRKSQSHLDRWLDELPEEFRFLCFANRPRIHGLVNLQLAYLSVQMLLRRLTWYECSQTDTNLQEPILRECQSAAKTVVRYAISLQPFELFGFWLPYNVQHFTSATTLLLRCALQTKSTSVRVDCIGSARNLVESLRSYRDMHGWDLAEIALPQSETILERIEQALPHIQPLQDEDDRFDKVQVEPRTRRSSLEQNHMDYESFEALSNTSLEQLFPEIFSSFDNYAFFDQAFVQDGFLA